MADYRGLENVGSGIGHLGDLLARGYKDQLDLQQQGLTNAHNYANQNLRNAIATQQAAQSTGFMEDNPQGFKALGGSFVQMPDVSSLSSGSSSDDDDDDDSSTVAAASPVASRSPAVVAPIPVNAGQGGDDDEEDLPTPPATTDVNQNAQLNQHYQQALTGLATQHANNPQLVNAQSGWGHPALAQAAQSIALKKYAADQQMAKARLIDEGKTDRAQMGGGVGSNHFSVGEKLLMNNVNSLNQQIVNVQKNQFMPQAQKDAQSQALLAQRDSLVQSMGHLAAARTGTAPASAQAPPQSSGRADGKYYSPKANKTYTYQGGVPVKVEDGHT